MSIPSPQTHNTHHPVFSPSPMPPSAAPTDEVTTPSEWDSLLHAAHLDFPWLPAQQQPPHSSKFKSEDDSDSAWSGNDSNSNNGASSEEIPTPPPQPVVAPRRAAAAAPRRRLGSVPRVTKPSKVPAGAGGGGVYHTFRMSKRPPAPAARPSAAVVDLIETTPFGPHPITNFGAAGAGAAGGDANDPAKMLEKRLAHKLSEKGRRNRLTSAIREIQRLMPLDAVTPVEGAAAGEKGGGEVVYPHFSKVDVVEMAIGYIRRLQKENEDMARKFGEGSPDGGGGEGMGS